MMSLKRMVTNAMIYSSTKIKGLVYCVNNNKLIVKMYDQSKSWDLSALDQCITQCQNDKVITEINRVIDAYKFLATKRKNNLDDKVRLMKILNIQYGELQIKLGKGELTL